MKVEQLGNYVLEQRPEVFPLGADSVDLSRFATVKSGFSVCDLGCGSGALGLLLLERQPNLTVTGVDVNRQAIALARDNFSRNGLPIDLHCCDVGAVPLPAGAFDLVISNPPFFAQGTGGDGGSARMESVSMVTWCATAAKLLKNGGRFALCHRPERLPEVLSTLEQVGLTPKRMQLVQHDGGSKPRLVLLEAKKQGRPGLDVGATSVRTCREQPPCRSAY